MRLNSVTTSRLSMSSLACLKYAQNSLPSPLRKSLTRSQRGIQMSDSLTSLMHPGITLPHFTWILSRGKGLGNENVRHQWKSTYIDIAIWKWRSFQHLGSEKHAEHLCLCDSTYKEALPQNSKFSKSTLKISGICQAGHEKILLAM